MAERTQKRLRSAAVLDCNLFQAWSSSSGIKKFMLMCLTPFLHGSHSVSSVLCLHRIHECRSPMFWQCTECSLWPLWLCMKKTKNTESIIQQKKYISWCMDIHIAQVKWQPLCSLDWLKWKTICSVRGAWDRQLNNMPQTFSVCRHASREKVTVPMGSKFKMTSSTWLCLWHVKLVVSL